MIHIQDLRVSNVAQLPLSSVKNVMPYLYIYMIPRISGVLTAELRSQTKVRLKTLMTNNLHSTLYPHTNYLSASTTAPAKHINQYV